jgi:AcrR family transcriptional regulator
MCRVTDGRVEKGKATRERLVAAGRELFGERGYEGTSIESILEAADVRRGALYHHFESKQELFDAVLDRVVVEIAHEVRRAAGAQADPADALRAGCNAWLKMALDPAIQRIALIDPPSVVGWTRWRAIDEEHTLGGLRRNLQLIDEQGRLAPGDVDLLAHMVLAAVTEAALMIARAEKPRAALKTGQATVDTLLDGLITDR